MIKRWLILITLGLFFFMVIIDGTIVVVAVPTIASALAVSPSQVNLLLTVYLTTISWLINMAERGCSSGAPICF